MYSFVIPSVITQRVCKREIFNFAEVCRAKLFDIKGLRSLAKLQRLILQSFAGENVSREPIKKALRLGYSQGLII